MHQTFTVEKVSDMIKTVEKCKRSVPFGREWVILRNAKKPIDRRIKSGIYINWRKEISDWCQ